MLIVEPFLDNIFIQALHNVEKELISPKKEKLVLSLDKPYEGKMTNYFSVVQTPNKIFMYYRAVPKGCKLPNLNCYKNSNQMLCVATSTNGYDFVKPSLDLISYTNCNKTNILLRDYYAHNFFPLVIENEFYGIGGTSCKYITGINYFKSNDGLQWTNMGNIVTKKDVISGICYFDSLNGITFNKYNNTFRLFLRHNPRSRVRSVQTCVVSNLEDPKTFNVIEFADNKFCQNFSIYEPNIINYPNSPFYIGFPCMIIANNYASKCLSVIFSRDGDNWKRINKKPFLNEYYKRPYAGVCGIVNTGNKFLIYGHNLLDHSITCFSFRNHGLSRLYTAKSGYVVTNKIKLVSSDIYVNFKTDKGGFLFVELYNLQGKRVCTSNKVSGDNLRKQLVWQKNNFKTGFYTLKILMYKCSLYSIEMDTVVE